MCLSFDLNEEASSYEDGYIAKVGGLNIEDDVTSPCFFCSSYSSSIVLTLLGSLNWFGKYFKKK